MKKKLTSDEDIAALVDLLERGATIPEIAETVDASPPTIAKRIQEIQNEHSVLLQYRAIQSLELTKLQAKCLMAITDDKINEASLSDLVGAFKILKDKELTLEGKPSDIKGLVGYLIQIEKEEMGVETPVAIDAEYTERPSNGDGDNDLPRL